VIGAGVRLRRALREDDASPAHGGSPASGPKARPDFVLANIKIKFQGHKPLAEGEAPLAWLMRRQRGVRKVVWMGALLGAPYYTNLLFFNVLGLSRAYSLRGIYMAFSVVEGCLFAWASSRFFIEGQRGGELELLMTTPEGARNMVASQWQWLKNVFWWPTVAMVAPAAVMSLAGFLWDRHDLYILSSQLIYCLSTFAGIVVLVWVGMWCGWSERSQARAIVRIVILAKGPPYIIGLLGSLVIQRIVPSFYAIPQFGVSLMAFAHVLVWAIPQIVILLYYFYLFRWARRRLEAQFGQTWPKRGLDSLSKFIYQPG
jgi:hypothetical protein